MLTGIREKTVVRENGTVEVFAPGFPIGKEVEVLVWVEEEIDETEYLLSSKANREHLEATLEEAKHPENFIRFELDELMKAVEVGDGVKSGA